MTEQSHAILPSVHQRRTALMIFGIGMFLIIIDRLSKWFALCVWADHPVEVAPGMRLLLLLNRGIAFSLPFAFWFITIVTILLLLLLALWCVRSIRRKHWLRAALLGVVLLGATSNLLDRFLYGGVVDYLQVVVPSVINLADVTVVVGIVGLILSSGKKNAVVEEKR